MSNLQPNEKAAPSLEDPILALGSRLAIVRAESKKTQAEFAKILGISARAYHLYECGKRSMPASTLICVSELNDVDLNWLLRGLGTAKIEDHSDEIREFVVSLHNYLDRTETKLRHENVGAIISRWVNCLLDGKKVGIDDVHLWIDFLKVQP